MNYLDIAKEVFQIEADAISNLSNNIDTNFSDAVDLIIKSNGRVIICGMGKSGIIGSKIAATFASTGTPSFFMHPGEAYHGDLGMVTREDVFLALSNSGETDEVIKLIPFLKENKNTLISLTGNPRSTLAKASNFHINIKVKEEACPLKLAPTSSTTATLAMGDALAVTLMRVRDFKPENFARFHPGGSLGRRLFNRVEDEMIKDFPLIKSDANIIDLISVVSSGGLGLCVINDKKIGIITDGDIRRALENFGEDIFKYYAKDIMTFNPITVELGTRMDDALLLMEKNSISSLLVKDAENIIGLVKR
jgi:arabinose-5-phosphate isomerase